jgi:Tol biopolymer transport system component
MSARAIAIFTCVMALLATTQLARAADDGDQLILKPTRKVSFTTTEGTRMSVDVSPDGKSIVFDLLGDIYSIPVEGGKAHRINAKSQAVNAYPRFSPHGLKIAFVSDRGGDAQTWTMKSDGTDPKLSDGQVRDKVLPYRPAELVPAWVSDNSLIILKSVAWNKRVLYQYDPATRISKELSSPKNCFLTAYAARSPARVLITCQGSNEILAYDGVKNDLIRKYATSITPRSVELSPDGKSLYYVGGQWNLLEKELHRIDVEDGTDTLLARLEQGSQLPGAHPSLPSFGISPDGKWIVIWSAGNLQRIDTATGAMRTIPFEVDVEKSLAPLQKIPVHFNDHKLRVRQILEPVWLPDGKTLIFTAAGKLWRRDVSGLVRRITSRPLDDKTIEFAPDISDDGRWIAFATWNETEGGSVWRIRTAGGRPERLTPLQPGVAYGAPRIVQRNRYVVALSAKVSLPTSRIGDWDSPGSLFQASGSLVRIDGVRKISAPIRNALPPVANVPWQRGMNSDVSIVSGGNRVVYWQKPTIKDVFASRSSSDAGAANVSRLFEAPINSDSDKEQPKQIGQVTGIELRGTLSPDGEWLALESNKVVYLVRTSKLVGRREPLQIDRLYGETAESITDPDVYRKGEGVIKVALGLAPKWSGDGKFLSWHFGATAYRAALSDIASGHIAPRKIEVKLDVAPKLPSRPLLLTNAKIVGMAGDPIACGDLLVVGRRIDEIGQCGTVRRPKTARVLDLAGRTIVPGFIGLQDITQDSSALTPFTDLDRVSTVGLAAGVTTGWDPGNGSQQLLGGFEAQEVGAIFGQRSLVPGCTEISPENESFQSIETVNEAFHKCALLDPTRMVEAYFPTTRLQRQWSVSAARANGSSISSEGEDYFSRIGDILDGFALLEHDYDKQVYYADLAKLWALSGTTWHLNGETGFGGVAGRNAVSMSRAGVYVGTSDESCPKCDKLGAVGAVLDIAEESPNLTPLEALRILTVNPAHALSIDTELGTLEPGKIADIVVLRKDPLDDIQNLTTVDFVILAGVVKTPDQIFGDGVSK